MFFLIPTNFLCRSGPGISYEFWIGYNDMKNKLVLINYLDCQNNFSYSCSAWDFHSMVHLNDKQNIVTCNILSVCCCTSAWEYLKNNVLLKLYTHTIYDVYQQQYRTIYMIPGIQNDPKSMLHSYTCTCIHCNWYDTCIYYTLLWHKYHRHKSSSSVSL